MKKFLVLVTVFLVSCGEAPKQEKMEKVLIEDTVPVESSAYLDMGIDTVFVDSTQLKISTLLSNTENAKTKVKEIKNLKEENKNLKQELHKAKTELNEIKASLSDTIEGAD